MLHGIKLFINRVHHTYHNYQHQHSLIAFRGKENKKMKNNNFTKQSFLVDNTNTLWTFEYDMLDNSVVVTSDNSNVGEYAVISQYTMDSSLCHGGPDSILSSAQELIEQDALRTSKVHSIISGIADDMRQERSNAQGLI